ncbi:MAG: hypothetical protein H7Z42_01800, partial [Roseiflexaceae bacterium]|nr:hypothetical protein [Roseiflexaceae bacterium]
IDPANQRAQQGLTWLEARSLIVHTPAPVVAPASIDGPGLPRERQHEREGWWVNMRRNRREMSRAWQVVLAGMILLLAFTLGLNLLLRETIVRATTPAVPTVVAAVPVATAAPTAIPILYQRSQSLSDAQTLAYLSGVDGERTRLRTAVDAYRETTSKLGNSAVLHAAAARDLRAQFDGAHAIIAELNPPPQLRDAHTHYLDGLDQERSAMDDMLEFYGSFRIQVANRAVLRLEEARQQIDQARVIFTVSALRANNAGPPAQTVR